jgi:hypothetical protein
VLLMLDICIVDNPFLYKRRDLKNNGELVEVIS